MYRHHKFIDFPLVSQYEFSFSDLSIFSSSSFNTVNQLSSITVEDKHDIDVIDYHIYWFYDQDDDELNNEEIII